MSAFACPFALARGLAQADELFEHLDDLVLRLRELAGPAPRIVPGALARSHGRAGRAAVVRDAAGGLIGFAFGPTPLIAQDLKDRFGSPA